VLEPLLRESGFNNVTVVHDTDRAGLIDALNRFSTIASNVDWALVYYAGHGIEMNGENYLVPVDANFATDLAVESEAVALDRVVNAVAGARRLSLVILDACRDNPFAKTMKLTSRSRKIVVEARGLAPENPPSRTVIAFAAKSGKVALDPLDNGASPFATALAAGISTKGLEIGRLFRNLTDDVLRRTGGAQEPTTYGTFPKDDIFFRES
jgi:uncharacterized caspase-like protein